MQLALLIGVAVLAVGILLLLLVRQNAKPHASDFVSLRERLTAADERFESLRRELETARRDQATLQERLRGETLKGVGDEFSRVQELLLKRLHEHHEFTDKRLDEIRRTSDDKLEAIRKMLQGNLQDTIEKNEQTFARVDRHLTDLSGQTRQIVAYSSELQKLQEIFKAPKPRGAVGEFMLEQLLADLIPRDRFELQWDLNGNKADAAIRTQEGWLCIDSKFPLDNFRRALDAEVDDPSRRTHLNQFYRDVRARIDEIATKYIVPGATLDFAFMFVPAENVYYELSTQSDITSYARDRKVIAVSPNTFFAYLATLAVGFRGLNIGRKARELEQTLRALQGDFGQFRDHYATLGRHVRNAFQKFQETESDVDQFSRRLSTLSLESPDETQLPLRLQLSRAPEAGESNEEESG